MAVEAGSSLTRGWQLLGDRKGGQVLLGASNGPLPYSCLSHFPAVSDLSGSARCPPAAFCENIFFAWKSARWPLAGFATPGTFGPHFTLGGSTIPCTLMDACEGVCSGSLLAASSSACSPATMISLGRYLRSFTQGGSFAAFAWQDEVLAREGLYLVKLVRWVALA